MRGFYVGSATINQDTAKEFIKYLLAYEVSGYQIEHIDVDKDVLHSLDEFEAYLNKVSFIKKICFCWKKNDNVMYFYNAKNFKEVWYIRHEIINEYDVYEQDKHSIYEGQKDIELFKKKFVEETNLFDVRFGLFISVTIIFLFLSKMVVFMAIAGALLGSLFIYFYIRYSRRPYQK